VTVSPVETDEPPVPEVLVPIPNPNPWTLRLKIKGRADEVRLVVYTKAETKRMVIQVPGPFRPGWHNLALGTGLAGLENGVYYVVPVCYKDGKPSGQKLIAKVMVLR
jgi:hypothetical protein